jgi:epoxyqueuosine reductase
MNISLHSTVEECIKDFGFDQHGWVPLERPFSLDVYEKWLHDGCHGEMTYLSRHLEQKRSPQLWMNNAVSALVVTQGYLSLPQPEQPAFTSLQIARYARGLDYHDWFKEKLERLAQQVKVHFPDFEWKSFTDSSPVLERDLAYRAGLGWVGKNTCLIHPKKGSFFFIGGLYTNWPMNVVPGRNVDHCGTCRRCIDACPTSALLEDRTMDARQCISYLTIEAKGESQGELRRQIGQHFFGCDICQDVCPWNHKPLSQLVAKSGENDQQQELEWILTARDEDILAKVKGTPLSRAKPHGLRRNARVVLENMKGTDRPKSD